MLSNGATYLANGVFLGVTRDDADHGFLFTDQCRLSHAPVSLLNLSRRTFFDISVDGLPRQEAASASPAADKKSNGDRAVASGSDGGQCASQSLRASCDGRYAVALSPFARRHTILCVEAGEVCEFITDTSVVSSCWHPTADHVLFLLGSNGTITALDVSFVAHHVAPRVLDRISAVDIFQALSQRRLMATAEGRKQSKDQSKDRRACKSGIGPSIAAKEGEEVAKRLVFVAITAVAETPGLPTMLLALTSRGDLISLKVGRDFHPECDATTAAMMNERQHLHELGADNGLLLLAGHNGSNDDAVAARERKLLQQRLLLSGTAVFSTVVFRPGSSDDDESSDDGHDMDALAAAPFCVHHVLQGVASDATTVAVAAPAIAVTAHIVDPHAGLHCVLVLAATGEVRGYYLYERELLSIDLHRSRCDVVVTLAMVPLKAPAPCTALNPHSSTTAPSGAGHTTHLESLRPLLQTSLLVSNGNVVLAKLNGSEHMFLIVLPVWCPVDGDSARQEWVYLEPAREGFDRIPCPGRDACDIPPAVATRVPLDVRGYSVAVGDSGTVLLFPQSIGCTGPDVSPPKVSAAVGAATKDNKDDPPAQKLRALPVLQLQTVELLDAALRSSIESTQVLGLSTSTTAAPPPSSSRGSYGKGAPADPSAVTLQRLFSTIGGIAGLHRATLCCTGAPEEHRKATAHIAEALEATRADLHAREGTTTARQERMVQRVTRLQERVAASTTRATRMRDILLDAIYSRDGVDEIGRVNRTLGELKKALNELQVNLTSAEEHVHNQNRESID